MQQQWRTYSEKFLQLTQREQYLVLFTGIVVVFLFLFNFFIEGNIENSNKQKKQIQQLLSENRSTQQSIELFQQALLEDPNVVLKKEIAQYENKLTNVDEDLLKLTSDLIDPVQMRYALLELLKLQKGVKLVSFEVMPVQPLWLEKSSTSINENNDTVSQVAPSENPSVQSTTALQKTQVNEKESKANSLGLYRHTIKLTLQGRYFDLRDYLIQLEGLSWTFFWQQFEYQLIEYPKSELHIEIYSLSTEQEFIGV